MPNWCANKIKIKGHAKTVKQLWEDAVENKGLLSAIAPLPKILEGTTAPTPKDIDPELQQKLVKETGFDNWYDWQVAHWGVKWDVSTENLKFKDHGDGNATIEGWFDSAWCPPITAYEKLCERDGISGLQAFYEEPNMCFVGFWDSESGDNFYDYADCTSKNFRDTIPQYIISHFNLSERFAEFEEDEEEKIKN